MISVVGEGNSACLAGKVVRISNALRLTVDENDFTVAALQINQALREI